MLILIVAGGPDKGRIYELHDHTPVVLGRDGSDVAFTDVKVSRKHARLWAEGGRWYIQDLESRHGTHRNHEPIADIQPLKDGDYLQIGSTVMVLARVNAETLERAALLPGFSPVNGKGRVQRRALIGAGALAASVLLGLNVASFVKTQKSAEQLDTLAQQAPRAADAIRGEVRLALDHRGRFERRLETMIAAFGPKHDDLAPKLDEVLAVLHNQPDVVGPLNALAQAVETRDKSQEIDTKIDAALALLQERGGDAEHLAEQFRVMLAEQPTVEQIAAATRQNNEQTVAVLGSIASQLDTLAAPGNAPGNLTPALGEQLAELRKLIEQRPAEDAGAAQLRPLLEQVLAKVENIKPTDSTDTVLAAIAEVKSALPPDTSAKLDAMLAQVATQPTAEDLGVVSSSLASLTAELKDRQDTQLIQTQLATLIEAQESGEARNADQALAATSDPLLGQILTQVQAIAQQNEKLDTIAAALEKQPYDNQAILKEITLLAEAASAARNDDQNASALSANTPDQKTTTQVIAAMFDKTMAELRGKSITDADQLRQLINREVASAVGAATGATVARRDASDRLTRTETAYKLAFESGQKITIGAGVTDPVTGQVSEGRTLDPALASAEGHRTWRDWYLMDDLANRMKAEQAATQFAERQRSHAAQSATLTMPGDGEVNASAARMAE